MKNPVMNLQSERIKLRHFEPSDLEDAYLFFGHPEVMRYSLSGPYSRQQTVDFLAWCQTQYANKEHGLFAVVHQTTDRVIGYCGYYFQQIDGAEEVEIGYRLHPAYWGQGLATEAAKLVRDHGFAHFDVSRFISIIEPENIASIRVAEKIGMAWWKPHFFKGKVAVGIYRLQRPVPG